MGAAPEICDSSSLDKYNLIGGAQKRGSVRGLSQVGGDRACWHFLLCLCLIAKLCQCDSLRGQTLALSALCGLNWELY